MPETIVIDPLTRIEGHLRIDLEVGDDQVVTGARSRGTSFRGFEAILAGRAPLDAPHITQRICGVCPIAHAESACLALEAALDVPVPAQGRLLRNVIQAANLLSSHVLHFYHLSLLDFVPGPSRPPWSPTVEFESRFDADREAAFQTNMVAALEIRRIAHTLGALVGGKLPHATGAMPGGATARPTAAQLAEMATIASQVHAFAAGAYAEDMGAIAEAYPELQDEGAGQGGYLAFGVLPDGDGMLLPAGVVLPGGGGVQAVDESVITEVTDHAYLADRSAHPSEGTTTADPDAQDAYTWMKAPRYDGHPVEVGPLARAIVAGSAGAGRGVMARHQTRWEETVLVATALERWIGELEPGADPRPAEMPTIPDVASGVGLTEAPRGALGHWVQIEGGLISLYQVISPTTWNCSPMDAAGQVGPMEHALTGIEVSPGKAPVEAVRVVHSYDPCVQCSVH